MASRLERLVKIDAYIRLGTYPSVERLSELFEVKPRTIFQDLRELKEMFGLDIRFEHTRNGYYNANPRKTLPPLAISYEEALLLSLSSHVNLTEYSISPADNSARLPYWTLLSVMPNSA